MLVEHNTNHAKDVAQMYCQLSVLHSGAISTNVPSRITKYTQNAIFALQHKTHK